MADLEHLHCVVCGGELVPDENYEWYACAGGHTVNYWEVRRFVFATKCTTNRGWLAGRRVDSDPCTRPPNARALQ